MAAINFDSVVNDARTILRGEAAGSVRFLLIVFLTLGVWVAASQVSVWTGEADQALASQEGRWRTLTMLAEEYKSLSVGGVAAGGNVDVPTVFAQVSEQMELGSRVNRLSPDGRNQSVEINRLYAEELTELERQLAARGVRFLSAEVRALPAGSERLLTVSAIIGPVGEGEAR